MARMQFIKSETFNLPKSVDELKCELYPKNADQLWKTYLEQKEKYNIYDDDIILQAIERTHTIAHEQIDKEVSADKKIKLPSIKKLLSDKDGLLQRISRKTLDEDESGLRGRRQGSRATILSRTNE